MASPLPRGALRSEPRPGWSWNTTLLKAGSMMGQVPYRLVRHRGDPRTLGRWVADELYRVGPAFTKLGQIMSVRGDLLGAEFTKELSRLQDRVPASFEPSSDRLDAFEWFEAQPMACGAIAQVHKARLRSGEVVAVKVRRPGLEEDYEEMRQIVGALERLRLLLPQNARATQDVLHVVQQSTQWLQQEMDFSQEARNMQVIGAVLKGSIRVPRVYERHSTADMIVQEYVPSLKITDVKGQPQLMTRLMGGMLTLLLDHGLYYGDCHAGNLGVTAEGELVMYDLGLVLDVSDMLSVEVVKSLIFHALDGDSRGVTEVLLSSGILAPKTGASMDDARQALGGLVPYLMDYAGAFGVGMNFDDVELPPLDIKSLGDPPVQMNPRFAVVVRALTLMDGIGRELDPEFKFYRHLVPHVHKVLGADLFAWKAQKDAQRMERWLERLLRVADAV